MRIKILPTGLLALAFFNTGYAQSSHKARLDQFFDRLTEKNKAMGSLSIAKDGQVQYTRSIGYSHGNAARKEPLTAATRYRIGSITKMFTAVMIFQLAEKGTLKLTDTLDKFFPQIPHAGKITIAHILAHRSGIHDITSDGSLRTERTNPKTKDEILGLMAKSTPDFEPDAKYAYSNTGYFLLGCLLEKLTGKSYAETLQERITSRIGLQDTYPATGNIDTSKNESFSYKYTTDWKQQPETHPSILFGSGALVSTPADLIKFIQALFDLELVSQQSLNQMMQDKLGMDNFIFAGKTLYGHTGGIDGFGSWLAYLPEEKLAVAYTANGKVYPVAAIISGVLDICWNRPFTIPSFESIVVSPEVLDNYVGVYSIPGVPIKFTITRADSMLFVQPTGQSAVPLEPTAQDKFRIESAGITFEFDTAKSQMILKRSGGEKVFTKEN